MSVYQYFLKPSGVVPTEISAIPLTEVALEMAEANTGICCFPGWALHRFRISKNIVCKPLGKSGLTRTHYLVTKKKDQNKKYIIAFSTQFINAFQK